MKKIFVIYLCLMLSLCGCRSKEDIAQLKIIEYAKYLHKDFPDIDFIEESYILRETESLYIITINLMGLPNSPWSKRKENQIIIFKNPINRNNNFGLWEDGDRVKEGKLCEE